MARKRHLFTVRIQTILRHRIWIFFLALWVGLMASLSFPVLSQVKQGVKPLEAALNAEKYYNAGDFDQAIQLWQEAADAYTAEGDQEGRLKSLINQSQALQDLGLYQQACQRLVDTFTGDNRDCTPESVQQLVDTLAARPNKISSTEAIGLRSLGDVLRRRGMLPESQAILKLSLSGNNSGETLLSLGNTERVLGNRERNLKDYEQITQIILAQSLENAFAPYKQALVYYQQAAETQSVSSLTQIQSQLNQLSLLEEIQQWWREESQRRINSWSRFQENRLIARAKSFERSLETQVQHRISSLLTQINPNLTRLTPSRGAIYAKLNFVHQALLVDRGLTQLNSYWENSSDLPSLLNTALEQARVLGDERAESYALGYLGKFYAQEEKLAQALQLTQQALILAQEQNLNGDAREIIYLWQSQLGSLLKKQGDQPGAIAAYAAAFNTLQSLRTDLNTDNQDVQFNFRQEVEPAYLELANLLLQSNLNEAEGKALGIFAQKNNQKKPLKLELAREVIESLQLAELDNFFQDPCSETSDAIVQIDDLDSQAAVIYPLVFNDRLEVILSLPGEPLQQFTTPVSAEKFNETIDQLYDFLYNQSVDSSAINIFRTIPLDPEELSTNLQQLLPISQQVYNWLIQPLEPVLATHQTRNLVFVLNGRLQRIPIAALYSGQEYLLEKYNLALVPSLQLLDVRSLAKKEIKVLAAGVSEQVQLKGEIFPALVNVPQELAEIKQTFPKSTNLLNQDFTTATMQKQLEDDFPIVHLATHGLFSSNPEKTFLLTGDRNTISIEDLGQLLTAENTSIPELLVLSACETATGDERAVLGLAGMAVRSGAKSTLATLWPVEDASTAKLMGRFYQELKKPGISKAEALRVAQLSLIDSLKNSQAKDLPPHPYSWAPYVLVGNWR